MLGSFTLRPHIEQNGSLLLAVDKLLRWGVHSPLRDHEVLDGHLAQIVRVAHACAGSFDDTLRDDLVYWIIPVADMKSL